MSILLNNLPSRFELQINTPPRPSKITNTMSDTDTSSNPVVEDPTSGPTGTGTNTDTDPEQGNTTPNPFEDVAPEDVANKSSDPETSTNPFDDPVVANKDESPINPFDDPNKDIATPHPDTEHRDRFYECNADDDSVRSMLEMMETKNDPSEQNETTTSVRKKKPRRSRNRWKWMSSQTPQNRNKEDVEEVESLVSYDCIALSSLKTKLTSGWGNINSAIDIEDNDDDDDVGVGDEESQRSKPTSFSEGTTTTKNTGNGCDSHGAAGGADLHVDRNFKSPPKLKYVIPLACFLAIMLSLGILVLSYSLYALRQEDGGEGLTIFSSGFWRKEVPKTLAFWKKDTEDASVIGL